MAQHIRILYIAHYLQPMNAASITTCEIIKKLAEKTYETTIVAPQRCPKKCMPFCSLACKGNTAIAVIKVPTLVPYYLINRHANMGALVLLASHLLLILQCIKIGKRERFNVVVSQHHPSHLASFSAFVVSRILHLPLIVKTHDVYNSSSNVIELVFLRTLDTVYREIFKRANFILVVSRSLRYAMAKTYKLEKDKILVFPNFVNTKEFRSDLDVASLTHSLEIESKKIVLFIGQIRAERGLLLLMKALPKIVINDRNIRVLIVGDGPQKHNLEELMQKLGTNTFVKFVRPMDHNEIPKYIGLCNVAIGPLEVTVDTFGSVPRKVLEYMACAKPVVACRGGVSEDLILDGYNGLLIHPGSVDELASAVLKIINTPNWVKEMGLHARQYVEKHYDLNETIKEFEDVLQASCTNNAGR